MTATLPSFKSSFLHLEVFDETVFDVPCFRILEVQFKVKQNIYLNLENKRSKGKRKLLSTIVIKEENKVGFHL